MVDSPVMDPVYSIVIKGLQAGNLHGDVELLRHSRKLKVADFTLANGKLLLLRDHDAVQVVPKEFCRNVSDDAYSGLLARHSPEEIFSNIVEESVLGNHEERCVEVVMRLQRLRTSQRTSKGDSTTVSNNCG
ncbi:hypothetical protein Y032_0160g3356 [Ancylostoma ceylanicum]|uniref:Uncharacterized protein n=1 Tax=Ancylostoma ceylanicum TaxID=53326 RepID=A0A016SYB3_9BILA|nr:hypothetical protein Y032_0160g3356 [Ancylostoma ceylanicum]